MYRLAFVPRGCGMYPNVLGPAIYSSQATINLTCIQELMRRRIVW